jgi:ribosomal protein L16 Arg81 hydroxylase
MTYASGMTLLNNLNLYESILYDSILHDSILNDQPPPKEENQMDKLTQVYLELATNPEQFQEFNRGKDLVEKQKSRQQFLQNAGIEHCDDIIKLSEADLQALLSKKLATQNKQWSDISKHTGNTTNTDNRVSQLGITPR